MRNDKLSLKYGSRAVAIGLAAGALALTGCSGFTNVSSVSAPIVVPGVSMNGVVHGGQQPVAGSTIQIYAANTAGYGSTSFALLNTTVLTTPAGNFTTGSNYTCPSASSMVYITATGGNPGSGVNSTLALMAALGPCGNLTSSTYIAINELTTVASVFALAPFMSSYGAVGTTSTNIQGMTNAFATVNNLVNTTTGALSGPTLPANAVIPTRELITLADIIASCVNTAGVTTGTNNCGSLFGYTTPAGGTAPTDTIGAALNIAKYPSAKVPQLIALIPAAAPYQQPLTSATDFTISIKYTPGLSTPSASAVDATGNVWIANAGNNSVTLLNPAGTPVAGSPFTETITGGPSGIAIDQSGNAWVTDKTASKLTVFTPAGVATNATVSGISQPTAIAIDGQGILWVTNSGTSSVTAVTTSGTSVSSATTYTAGGTNTPVAVAINPN